MINSRLRSIRKELSLTQENLARVLGIGKSALSMIETGKASLSERNKNILVQELNVNPDWLETGEGPMFLEVRPAAVFAGRSDRRFPRRAFLCTISRVRQGWVRCFLTNAPPPRGAGQGIVYLNQLVSAHRGPASSFI